MCIYTHMARLLLASFRALGAKPGAEFAVELRLVTAEKSTFILFSGLQEILVQQPSWARDYQQVF